jgi:RNA polymerase subunit RPABC4/transcription elongation factor Spt4
MFGVVFAQFHCRTSPIQKTGVGAHTKHEFSPPEPFLCFSQRTCPIHYFRSKTHVWGGFAQFRCCTSPIPKTGVGVHTKHEFSPPEPFLRFAQQTCPIHYFRSKTHVWGGFAQFRCCTSPIPKTGVGVHTKHEFSPPEPFLRFAQQTCPIHYFRSKTHVWGGFAQFRCHTSPIPKTGVGVHTSTSFCHQNHLLVFHNEHAQSTTLGPKLMFGVISRNFIAAHHPFRKRVSGCIQSTSFCNQNHFVVFCNEHAQSTTLGPKLMFG